jgi:hypothetical protein
LQFLLRCVRKSETISSSKQGDKPRKTLNSLNAGAVSGLQSNSLQRKPKSVADAERKKKILHAEKQLVMQPSNPSAETSSQTNRTIPSKMGNKTMVAPGTRDAPKFSSKKPQELRRFVRQIEDLWREASVEDDELKKCSIGKYADQESEEEWAAFDTYEKGHTWEEFKAELIENYPEAAAAERGTPARIRQLCEETRGIRLGDLTALYAFRRSFMAEAKKLVKKPAAMANRELVELFIGCLSESLASSVLQLLGNGTSNSKDKTKTSEKGKEKEEETATGRRPEDKYDLEDVCRAAVQVSESSQGMLHLLRRESLESAESTNRGVYLFNQPVSETKALSQKVEELEGVQALEKDRLVVMNKTMDSKIGEIESMIKTLLAQGQAGASDGVCKEGCKGSCKTHDASTSGSTQKWGMPMDNERCFFCGKRGHFQADCNDMKDHVRQGNVKVNPEGKLRLRDGSFIPNQPVGATLKERVERHLSKRPSQFFYGEYEEDDPPVSKYASQYLNTSEDAERRVARLEAELAFRKKEEALELRKKKLEQEEKQLEKSGASTRATHVFDLLGQLSEEEMAAVKAARAGFH